MRILPIILTASPDLLSQRDEIIQWVVQGGGKVVDDHVKKNVHFSIECHGEIPRPVDAPHSLCVSSHWIRSCLEVCLTEAYIRLCLY